MPNIKSQIKRVQLTAVQNARNTAKRSEIKTEVKKYKLAIANKDFAYADDQLRLLMSLINAAATDGIYHKNNASRKIGSLSKMLSDAKQA